jgi:hypothetical protein
MEKSIKKTHPKLIHNGVGIADMYQPGELEKELMTKKNLA